MNPSLLLTIRQQLKLARGHVVVVLKTFIKIRKMVKAAGVSSLGDVHSLAKQKCGLPQPVLVQILVEGGPICFFKQVHEAGRADMAQLRQGFHLNFLCEMLMDKIKDGF